MLFSGDLGPDEKVFHLEPDAPAGFDYILCESTYGDREREDATVEERRAALKREILEAHDDWRQSRDPGLCGGAHSGTAA